MGVKQKLNPLSGWFDMVNSTGTNPGDAVVLDNDGKIPVSTIPATAITERFVAASQAEMLALDAQIGDICARTDENKIYQLMNSDPSVLSNWIVTNVVSSVNNQTGDVVVNDVKIGSTAPTNPTEGMAWYDTTNNLLKSYNGSSWETTGDMRYSDMAFYSRSGGGTLVISHFSEDYVATNNFTMSAGTNLKEGCTYLVRITSQLDRTVTLGTGIANPSSIPLTIKGGTTTQFIFLATSNATLELQSSLPTYTASSTERGLIKLGSDTVQTEAVQSPTSAVGRTYPVQINGNEQAVVNVPGADVVVSNTPQQTPSVGSQWYDTTNGILKVYDGTNWREAGENPQYKTQEIYSPGERPDIEDSNTWVFTTDGLHGCEIDGTNVNVYVLATAFDTSTATLLTTVTAPGSILTCILDDNGGYLEIISNLSYRKVLYGVGTGGTPFMFQNDAQEYTYPEYFSEQPSYFKSTTDLRNYSDSINWSSLHESGSTSITEWTFCGYENTNDVYYIRLGSAGVYALIQFPTRFNDPNSGFAIVHNGAFSDNAYYLIGYGSMFYIYAAIPIGTLGDSFKWYRTQDGILSNGRLDMGTLMSLYQTEEARLSHLVIDSGGMSISEIGTITDSFGYIMQKKLYLDSNLRYLGYNIVKQIVKQSDIERRGNTGGDYDKVPSLGIYNTDMATKISNSEFETGMATKISNSEFEFETATSGATLTISDLNTIFDPNQDFTIACGTVKEGMQYIVRATTDNTSYDITLGTGVTNPFEETLTLGANKITTLVFLATSNSTLELFSIKAADRILPPNWLCFSAERGGDVTLLSTGTPTAVSLEISTDGITWSDYTIGDGIYLTNRGDKIYMRNKSETDTGFSIDSMNYYSFSIYGDLQVSGDVTYLLNKNGTDTLSAYCFMRLFDNCEIKTAPELPATTLANSCYANMFAECMALTTAPELPATTLANSCYANMFQGCMELTTAPELPATSLTNNCYDSMFTNCTALTTAPELPATTLANSCYANMFSGCVALTTAPELPATTLAENCYSYMFEGCFGLTTVPELPATTLADGCYGGMFMGSSAIELSDAQDSYYTQPYRIPTTGTGTEGVDSLVDMFDGTGGAFTGTPTINTTYYLHTT